MKASRDQWLQAGFALLLQKGPVALKVEPLCRFMGLTKGAFYHHFDGLGGFQQALLDDWEARNTDEIMQAVDLLRTTQDRREMLSGLANGRDPQLENALRAWALYNEDVDARLKRVDTRRVDFLKQLIAPDVVEGVDALVAARVVYAHFVGWQQLHGHLPATALKQMENLLKAGLLRNP